MISMNKKYRTRDGSAVRILCTDAKHEFYPVIALVDDGVGETVEEYTLDGKYMYPEGPSLGLDLVEVREPPYDEID